MHMTEQNNFLFANKTGKKVAGVLMKSMQISTGRTLFRGVLKHPDNVHQI